MNDHETPITGNVEFQALMVTYQLHILEEAHEAGEITQEDLDGAVAEAKATLKSVGFRLWKSLKGVWSLKGCP